MGIKLGNVSLEWAREILMKAGVRAVSTSPKPRESRKRESKIRINDVVVSLPTDIHVRLVTAAERRRYPRQWDCLLYLLDLGLIVDQKLHNMADELINKTLQGGTSGA